MLKKAAAHRVNYNVMGALLCHVFCSFVWAGLLFLITYPICDTARRTLYEREVAPGAGHRRASALISKQVIRQTGWARRQGHGGTGGGRLNRRRREGWRGRGDCGTAVYPTVWVCSPRGTPLRWTGMRRADNHAGGRIHVRTKSGENNNPGGRVCPAWWKRRAWPLFFGLCSRVFDSDALFKTCPLALLSKQRCNKKKAINIESSDCILLFVCWKKKCAFWVCV